MDEYKPCPGDEIDVTWVDIEGKLDVAPNEYPPRVFVTSGEFVAQERRKWRGHVIDYLFVRGDDFDIGANTYRSLNAIPITVVLDMKPMPKSRRKKKAPHAVE